MYDQKRRFIWNLAFYMLTSFSIVVSHEIDIRMTSLGAPNFYLNDTITFTCSTGNFINIGTLELRYTDGNNVLVIAGCTQSHEGWEIKGHTANNNTDGIENPGVVMEDCVESANLESYAIQVDVVITNRLVRGKFYCTGLELGEEVLSHEIDIPEIKVHPRSIQLKTYPEEPVEGEEVTFTCSSEGADPVSKYNYEVNGVTVSKNAYTPFKTDREGVTLSCTDTEHSNWKGGNTYGFKRIVPKYISATTSAIISKTLSPKSEGISLSCPNYIQANPPPFKFGWEVDGMAQNESSISTVSLTPQLERTMMVIKCGASNGLASTTVTITWYTLWSSCIPLPEATITRQPITEDCTCPSVAAIVGGVIASVIFINILLVVIECHCRTRRAIRNRQLPKISTNEVWSQSAVGKAGDDNGYETIHPVPPPIDLGPEASEEYLTPVTLRDTAYVDMNAQRKVEPVTDSTVYF